MADRGLGAALAQVNSVYAVSHLYRVTRGSVTRVSLHIPKDILSCFFYSCRQQLLQCMVALCMFYLWDYDKHHMCVRLFPWAWTPLTC